VSAKAFTALEAHGASLCKISYPELTCPVRATARAVYIRSHGAQTLYASRYGEEELRWWAKQIEGLVAGGHEPRASKTTTSCLSAGGRATRLDG
jgi:uncharacterized protein YecE (DUF72 family)